jgi:hypothetical protein
MKRLGFRSAFVSTEEKLEREPNPRKPLNPNCFILCVELNPFSTGAYLSTTKKSSQIYRFFDSNFK